MSPDQITDALLTVLTAAIGYGAVRGEVRALRLEIQKHKEETDRRLLSLELSIGQKADAAFCLLKHEDRR